jgi:hypothetical protein
LTRRRREGRERIALISGRRVIFEISRVFFEVTSPLFVFNIRGEVVRIRIRREGGWQSRHHPHPFLRWSHHRRRRKW